MTIDGVTYEAPDTDILGIDRPNPSGTSPDIGAYESSESAADYNPHKYVATTGSNSNSGVLTDPFLTIQYAIDQAQDDDFIHVAAGTYVENIDYNGKNISIIGADRETTIIDGNQSGSVVTFENGEDTTAVLRGFTITNGYANNAYPNNRGGGIKCMANPSLQNLNIIGNSADNVGGGMFIEGGSNPRIKNILIINNSGYGGGIYLNGVSNQTLENVTVCNNIGGGIFSQYSNFTIVNSIILDNSGDEIRLGSSTDSLTLNYNNLQGGEGSIFLQNNGHV
ncbi:MAG: right-handed parallel beta-helix repeat-containing protein, partial [Arenicellales bacterium]|nr:right-handed parallel beta-helix repeat-containing protein [Arenicellales bacterium]